MDQFIGQLQQKMQEFRIGVLRVEDVDEANGKIIPVSYTHLTLPTKYTV